MSNLKVVMQKLDNKKKKVGIIIDSITVSKQIYDFIIESQNAQNYEISTLIIQSPKGNPKSKLLKLFYYFRKRGIRNTSRLALFNLLILFETLILKTVPRYKKYFTRYNLKKFSFSVIQVKPNTSPKGFYYNYGDYDLNLIKQENLDVLVRGGSGILQGDILNICPLGIVSFHHGDNNINRGGPPGFWEVYTRQPKTGFIIQILNNDLDGGDVVFKGHVPTTWLYTANLIRLYEVSNPFLFKVLDTLCSTSRSIKVQENYPYYNRIYTTPKFHQQIIYIFKVMKIMLVKLCNRLRNKKDRWGVAFQYVDDWRDASLYKSTRIQNPPNRFLADPFIYKYTRKNYCFVEDFDYKTKKGVIAVYLIDNQNVVRLGVALEEDFHLSFPYIFEYDSEIYMCPETQDSGQIRIYKCVDFPLKWELCNVAIDGIKAVDSLIFQRSGAWFLMTNTSSSEYDHFDSELHLYTSDCPIKGQWQPVRSNPVLVDSGYSRNGGLLQEGDKYYRVGQSQGFAQYGEHITISEISLSSTRQYKERPVCQVRGNFFPNSIGIHTFNFKEGLLVFDYCVSENVRK
ncbi:hypothetical protein OAP35_04210 [Planktomarina temperata]|nr:hypothetical protein [Planktomarina temperata]